MSQPVLAAGSVALVAVLWWRVFRRSGARFWAAMAVATGCLGLVALAVRGPGGWVWHATPADLALGAAGAFVLYLAFRFGDWMLQAVAPGVAAAGDGIYGWTASLPRVTLAALLLLVIGPGEELYWRGLVQWQLQQWLPAWAAVVAAAAVYAAVHLSARNPALVLAALVGGLFWGGLYAALGHLAPVILCHALWDCLALLWLPLRPPGGTDRARAGGSNGAASGPAASGAGAAPGARRG